MAERPVVTSNVWLYGVLSVVRDGKVFRIRHGSGMPMVVNQRDIATSLLPIIAINAEWHRVGHVYFVLNSFRLELSEGTFSRVTYFVDNEKIYMPTDFSTSLLKFLLS